MCDLCETRKLVARADRVIEAIGKGECVSNLEALGLLMFALRQDLVKRHNDEAVRSQNEAAIAALMGEDDDGHTPRTIN